MAAIGTIRFYDDAVTTVGAARGWKVGFGYVGAKGAVVSVYVVAANGIVTNTTEIPKLGNGKADVTSISNYLSSFGVTLTNALKTVIGA